MMYIIYNADGSIKKTNLTEFIQKGNDGENVINVAVEGKTHEQYSVSAVFTLPNYESITQIADPIDSFEDASGTSYTNGYQIVINGAVTLYSGRVLATIRVVDLETNVLYTYLAKLTINETGNIDVEHITWSEYDDLLNYIKTNYEPKKSNEFLRTSKAQNGELLLTFDDDVVVLFGAIDFKKSKLKKYKPSQLAHNKKGNYLSRCDFVVPAGSYTAIELLRLVFPDDCFDSLIYGRTNELYSYNFSSGFDAIIGTDEEEERNTVGIYTGQVQERFGEDERHHPAFRMVHTEEIEGGDVFCYISRLRFVKNFSLRGEDKTKGWTGQMSNYQLRLYLNVNSYPYDEEFALLARITD